MTVTVDELDQLLDEYWETIGKNRRFLSSIRYQWELRPEADKPVLVFIPWWDQVADTFKISTHVVSSTGNTTIPDYLRKDT